MPRLHKYVNRDGHYVLTRIDNAIRTFQLTPSGESKLATAGVLPGHSFGRALLFDLFRSGEAFTRGGEGEIAEAVLASQLEMDFDNDPDPETAFPVCDGCKSVVDLHLIYTGGGAGLSARLQCSECLAKAVDRPDTSVPLEVMTRSLFVRLNEVKGSANKTVNVDKYEALLAAEFESKWIALRRRRDEVQPGLFGDGEGGGLRLL